MSDVPRAGTLSPVEHTERFRGRDALAVGPERGDADRVVEFTEDDAPHLPEQTRDDTDTGWGELHGGNDARLLDERPPHW
ncbi:hypothetical protein GCM10010123_22480 [Pilimelia anulata]|uniref:Uncharacterized protein n=1 Tax=Pilimelia anulata TaxID=53371 RepID=A0A8J3BA39_9ACTN|nr:hypothetical protein [Pilimelia anulata]GGJ92171.1 hypothetical protein GCM10010123_22480 [Pilimelia anulata]